MSIIYYIDKIGWNTVVELADLGLLTWYEEAVSLIADVRHYANLGQYTVAMIEVVKLERALRLLLYIMYKYLVEHKRRPPEEYTELVKTILDKWNRLFNDFKKAVDTITAKKLGIQQQFIGEGYVGLYINRLIDFVEMVAFNITNPDRLRRELAVTVASMPQEEGNIPVQEISEIEELAAETTEQEQTPSDFLSDDELKLVRYVVNNGGSIDIGTLSKRLKKSEEDIINMLININQKVSQKLGISENILVPTRKDTSVYIEINKELAKALLDILPKNSKLYRILKKL